MDAGQYLEKVKEALGVTGTYHDASLTTYIEEVLAYLIDGGVQESKITAGIVCRGVADLWADGTGAFSPYFRDRAVQLALKGDEGDVSG